ncbi:hypothetical protein MYX82_05060 [Acidobacteria bacterium AH-259-D05]|nr:hypothetical protein [Acidobacteria bacterium AH-259-D05]
MKFFLWLVLLQTPIAHNANPKTFPPLAELERILPESPDLRAMELELEKEKVQQSWQNHVTLHGNYSQHFSSFAPFVPTPDLAVSGGTFVGVSVSIKLAKLLGQPTPEELDYQLMVLKYKELFQQKLANLRLFYRRRAKLISHLEALAAQRHTVNLKLKKVQIGLSLIEGAFDLIDLAEAQEKVARIKSEKEKTELDIENMETEIWALLGKGKIQP